MSVAQYKSISLAGTSGVQVTSGITHYMGLTLSAHASGAAVTVHDGTDENAPLIDLLDLAANTSGSTRNDGIHVTNGVYVYNSSANATEGAVYVK